MIVPRISGVRSKLELGHIRANCRFCLLLRFNLLLIYVKNVLLICEMENDRGVAAFIGEGAD